MREFGVSGSLHQALYAFAEPEAIIGDIKQVIVRRRIDGQIGGRHVINRSSVKSSSHSGNRHSSSSSASANRKSSTSVRAMLSLPVHRRSCGTRKICSFQFDQNARIWASSS